MASTTSYVHDRTDKRNCDAITEMLSSMSEQKEEESFTVIAEPIQSIVSLRKHNLILLENEKLKQENKTLQQELNKANDIIQQLKNQIAVLNHNNNVNNNNINNNDNDNDTDLELDELGNDIVNSMTGHITKLNETNLLKKQQNKILSNKSIIPRSSPLTLLSAIYNIELSAKLIAILETLDLSKQCEYLQQYNDNDIKREEIINKINGRIHLNDNDKIKLNKIFNKYHEIEECIKYKDIGKWNKCDIIISYISQSISIVNVQRSDVWQFADYLRMYINHFGDNVDNLESFLISLQISKNNKLSPGVQMHKNVCTMYGFTSAQFMFTKKAMNQWVHRLYAQLHPGEYLFSLAPFIPYINRKEKNEMFISKEFGEKTVNNRRIMEEEMELNELLQYLRCTVDNGIYRIYKSNNNKSGIIIFETKLHSITRHDILYLVGITNDIDISKWKCLQFMTISQIKELGINQMNTSQIQWNLDEKKKEFENNVIPTGGRSSGFVVIDRDSCNDRSIMYIDENQTENVLSNNIIYENFNSSKQLFHFLRWTIKMQQIDDFYKIFKSIDNGLEIIMFNIELHTKTNNAVLYAVGIQNDDDDKMIKHKWKLIQFMTSKQLDKEYGINSIDLPKGSRTMRWNKEDLNSLILKDKIKSNKSLRNTKKIKTKQQTEAFKENKNKNDENNIFNIGFTAIKEAIDIAINSKDNKYKLIAIIIFNKQQRKYEFCQLLPININGHWIGIGYNKYYIPKQICSDWNDIWNKAILYDPNSLYQYRKFNFYKNGFKKLIIDHDS